MRLWILLLAPLLHVPSGAVLAQSRTETTVIARTALHRESPNRYLEVIQTRGRWIFPDVGYFDLGAPGRYREFWAGGGGVLFSSDRLLLIAEALVATTRGSASATALYLQPWLMLRYRLSPRLAGEMVYLPYIPLDKKGFTQHLLERAKLEYDFGRVRSGAGYGGFWFEGGRWEHRPFLTTTLEMGPLGSLEFWLQKVSGPGRDLRTQIRYLLNVSH